MTTDVKRLLDDALRLADADRAELAGLLIESLDDSAEEIARRLADLDNGSVKPIPWAEVRRRMTQETK
jgi:hypothetical protein